MSVIQEIHRDREDLARVLKNHPGIRKIVEDLYPDRAHFIYELLQNAEDKDASEVWFDLSKDDLVFEHNGKIFEEDHIRAITDIGEGTKAAGDEKIGRFGLGFKAVFAYTETPRIWSPKFAFEISDLVLPTEIRKDDLLGELTRFEFPFNNPKKSKSDAFGEVRAGLHELSETTLLFLSHIESIHWRVDGGSEGRLLRISHTEHHVEILRERDGKATKSSHFLRFMELVEGQEQQHAAIAFVLDALPVVSRFDKTKPLAKQFRITPVVWGRVAVYFTAAKETSGLRFHLHAPFVPELSRASIKDTPANEPLFQQLANLTAQSLSAIRDLGFLNRDFLAVLPNPHNDLPDRYGCIREAIVDAMNKQPLTPTHAGTHEPARQLLQARASLKTLLAKEDIEILVDFEETPLAWAIGATQGATQKDKDIDSFLSSLDIRDWDIKQLVERLVEGLSSKPRFSHDGKKYLTEPDKTLLQWLRSKSDDWHQKLYALLNGKESEGITSRLKYSYIVSLSTGDYMVGNECYFPTEDVQEDTMLPRVAIGTYTSGRNRKEQIQAKEFLESIGVREVGEREQVEAILKQRYSKEAENPDRKTHKNDLRLFISLVENDPKAASLFKDYWIFERADDQWGQPDQVYLDTPYFETGLHAYYRSLGDTADRVVLADSYKSLGISQRKLVDFAKAVSTLTNLVIEKQSTCEHPMSNSLRQDYHQRGVRSTHTRINDDWTISDLTSVLDHPSEELSRLVWHTMTKSDESILEARFRPNQQYETKVEPSTLVLTLQELPWVPQRDGEFVRPAEASRDLLPEGFPFDPGWPWIKAICFGEESVKRLEEIQRQREEAKELGFDDAEALDDAKWFGGLNAEERQRLKSEHESKRITDLPDDKPSDPGRRAEKVREQAKEAPDRGAVTVPRSVSEHREAVKKDTDPYLRTQYTNGNKVMICQVCKNALPFKLADGNYFFEAVEFLQELRRRHYQNYLALCPNHAAMYRHANGSAKRMKSLFLDLTGNELKVVLARKNKTVYFTKTHIADLKDVIATADTNEPEI